MLSYQIDDPMARGEVQPLETYRVSWIDAPTQTGTVLDETDRKALVRWDGGGECWEWLCDLRALGGEL